MAINIGDVMSVYKKSGILDDIGGGAAVAQPAANGTFGNMVKDFLSDSVSGLHEGEAKAASSVATGKTDLASVVTAMNNAEVALTEIVMIRDKVISAYQTITSSAI